MLFRNCCLYRFMRFAVCRVCLSSRQRSSQRGYLPHLGQCWWTQMLSLERHRTHWSITHTTTSGQHSFLISFVSWIVAYRCSASAVWTHFGKLVNSDSVTVFKSSLLPGFLSSLFSVAHCLAQRLWSYDLMALYKYVYYYYYFFKNFLAAGCQKIYERKNKWNEAHS